MHTISFINITSFPYKLLYTLKVLTFNSCKQIILHLYMVKQKIFIMTESQKKNYYLLQPRQQYKKSQKSISLPPPPLLRLWLMLSLFIQNIPRQHVNHTLILISQDLSHLHILDEPALPGGGKVRVGCPSLVQLGQSGRNQDQLVLMRIGLHSIILVGQAIMLFRAIAAKEDCEDLCNNAPFRYTPPTVLKLSEVIEHNLRAEFTLNKFLGLSFDVEQCAASHICQLASRLVGR